MMSCHCSRRIGPVHGPVSLASAIQVYGVMICDGTLDFLTEAQIYFGWWINHINLPLYDPHTTIGMSDCRTSRPGGNALPPHLL
uniref:Uncharacterized protein n=1 Tax=Engystomops pustulosus TaxID=76066 RepID=A0AAV6YQP2_ENGPU|nr:hypothetical protein GDO81_026602 [Engystomops pustulosus]